LYKRDDIEVKLFLTISDALQHNFMEDLYSSHDKSTDLDTVFETLKLIVQERMNEKIKE